MRVTASAKISQSNRHCCVPFCPWSRVHTELFNGRERSQMPFCSLPHTHAHSLAAHCKTSVCHRQIVGRLRLLDLDNFSQFFFFFFTFFTRFGPTGTFWQKKKISLASPILDSENFSPKTFFSFLHVLDPKDHFSNINLISIFFAHFWT